MATPVHLWEFLGIEGSIKLSQACMWFSIYVSGLCLFILTWCCPVCDRMNYDCFLFSFLYSAAEFRDKITVCHESCRPQQTAKTILL